MALNGTQNWGNQVSIPEFWSSLVLEKYYAEDILPKMTNQKFKEIINAKGDTVHILNEPTWNVYDHVVGADLNWQNVDDAETTLTINYDKVSSVEIPDEWKRMSAVDLKAMVIKGFSKAHSEAIQSVVLGAAYASASSVINSSSDAAIVKWGITASNNNAAKTIAKAAALLSTKKIPMENRWLLLHPLALMYLNLDVANYAQNAGTSKGAQIVGYVGEYAGFSVFTSPLVTGTGASGTPFNCMAGHMDAISIASNIKEIKVKDLSNKLGEGIVGQTLFGFKVTQPDALVHIAVDTASAS